MDGPSSEYDVIIVGGGIGGLTAAACLSRGPAARPIRVLLLEKRDTLGGVLSEPMTIPGLWVPRSLEHVRELQRWYPQDKKATANSPEFTESEMQGLLNDSHEAIDQLIKIGALPGIAYSDRVSYYGDTANTVFASATRQSWMWYLLTTVFDFFISFAAPNLHAAAPRDKVTGRLMLPGAVVKLKEFVMSGCKSSVTCMLNTTCEALHRDGSGDRWIVEVAEGQQRHVMSSKHVIFASGGFAANRELMRERGLGSVEAHCWNQNTGTGVLERLTSELGLSPAPGDQAANFPCWWCEAVSLGPRQAAEAGSNQCVLFLNGDGMMVVNASGRRVYNEKDAYAKRGAVCFEHGWLLVIADGRSLRESFQGLGTDARNVCLPSLAHGDRVYLRASSATELADTLAARGLADPSTFHRNFPQQLASFNSNAAQGCDPEFGRGSASRQLERAFFPAGQKSLRPIDTADLYACVLRPSALDTCAGLAVDSSSRLISASRSPQPVPGLFAVGNCAASLTHGLYLAGGVPAMSAVIGAHRAARCIAAELTPTAEAPASRDSSICQPSPSSRLPVARHSFKSNGN